MLACLIPNKSKIYMMIYQFQIFQCGQNISSLYQTKKKFTFSKTTLSRFKQFIINSGSSYWISLDIAWRFWRRRSHQRRWTRRSCVSRISGGSGIIMMLTKCKMNICIWTRWFCSVGRVRCLFVIIAWVCSCCC